MTQVDNLSEDEKEALDRLREYHGLFKKMHRFVCVCGICTRASDVMAYDAQDAGKRLTEKGWKTIIVSQKGKESVKVLTCKRCGKLVLEAQAKKDSEQEKARNN